MHPALAFASGTNDLPEIDGFLALGIPVGASAPRLAEAAIQRLLALAGTGTPVFLDSGAFGETDHAPISNAEWTRRLALYDRLATALGPALYAVLPDRLGSQKTTLKRLIRYRAEIRQLHARGATLLLALQQGDGEPDRAAFYHQATLTLGFRPVPALPVPRGGVTPEDAIAFTRSVRPERLHLLGMGLANAHTAALLDALSAVSPETRVSMDSVLITAAVRPAP